ncbi:MAG: histidine triad nucleotide-binding protein [Oscillospiraceae bacterium]|jgi:histidine triad (HIT) family protein|nr:histidine triad nucleotide-binding protein [Oscillospiraceae bacterium]
MTDCVFCKIAAGEIPSETVYEDESVLAFRDINPQAPTHILVIPKEHIASAADISPESGNSARVASCFEAIAKIARSEGLGGGFRVITNVGEDGGQTVRHLHFHLLGGVKMGDSLTGVLPHRQGV